MDRHPKFPPLDLSQAEISQIKDEIYDWSFANGLLVKAPPKSPADSANPDRPSTTEWIVPPVTLYPSLFPREQGVSALVSQGFFDLLYAAIASDEAWLEEVLKDVFETDDFVRQLWHTHQSSKTNGALGQSIGLGLFRSDYMIDVGKDESGRKTRALKQVEFNTIAVSFAGLAVEVQNLHSHLESSGLYGFYGDDLPFHDEDNCAYENFSYAISCAHQYFIKSLPSNQGEPKTCVLVVHQPGERNIVDQKKIESMYLFPFIRLPFNEILNHLKLDNNRNLVYTRHGTEYLIAVVYWRAAYSPSEYEFPNAWEARLLVERSTAIKCPDILTQLAGTKKVQQVLATPGSDHLSRFIDNPKRAKIIRNTFVPIYPLDDSPAGREGVKLALDPATAVNYVLKPQREGGGNNIYRDAIPTFLSCLPKDQWRSYILMRLIKTPEQHSHILRNGEVTFGKVVPELGVFGDCVWDRTEVDGRSVSIKKILSSKNSGHLVRTKAENSDEGGIVAGFGSLDSLAFRGPSPGPFQELNSTSGDSSYDRDGSIDLDLFDGVDMAEGGVFVRTALDM